MKRCPRCEKTYPDSETFCDTDGTALVQPVPPLPKAPQAKKARKSNVRSAAARRSPAS